MDAAEARHRFATLVTLPQGEFRLAEGALLIAQEEQPALEMAAYLQRLDAMAAVISSRLGLELEPQRLVAQINAYLFEEEGFQGNQADYYDPRNSFLNDVLDRKMGIPITLSVVYLDIARLVGLPIVGVGLPGHFIVHYGAQPTPFWIDPFHQGAVLTREDCATRLEQIHGAGVPWNDTYLQPVSDHQVLMRMLNNLKGIYIHRSEYLGALRVVERLLLLAPNLPTEVRDRGLLAAQLGHIDAALDDLQHYLQLAPEAPDATIVTQHIARLRQQS